MQFRLFDIEMGNAGREFRFIKWNLDGTYEGSSLINALLKEGLPLEQVKKLSFNFRKLKLGKFQ